MSKAQKTPDPADIEAHFSGLVDREAKAIKECRRIIDSCVGNIESAVRVCAWLGSYYEALAEAMDKAQETKEIKESLKDPDDDAPWRESLKGDK